MADNEPHQYPEFVREESNVVMKSDGDVFTTDYPNISAWVEDGGFIEIGTDHNTASFIRALDEGGIIWHGATEYPTMDAAFKALEDGIAGWLAKQGIAL